MQKRLYKKRHHKVQINAGHLQISNEMSLTGSLVGSYSRNFGHFEIGALLGFSNVTEFNFSEIGQAMETLNPRIGLVFEGNFIKNKRRNNWIPSGGLKIIYVFNEHEFGRGSDRSKGLYANLFLSSKHFISSRTSINIELEYPLKVWEWDTEDIWKGLDPSIAYAYYFH